MSIHNTDEIIERSKEMLKSSINNKSINLEEINDNIIALQQVIKLNPKLGKEVGFFIQELIAIKKSREKKLDLIQVPVLQGHLSIGHRPKMKEIPLLKREGITHVVTLLSRKEGAEKIGKKVRKWDLEWIWHPMENANPPGSYQHEKYVNLFKIIHKILVSRGSVHIHCSAGIHRTGMITFALLLYLGFNEQNAIKILSRLRDVTLENVGAERLEWGKDLLNSKENQF